MNNTQIVVQRIMALIFEVESNLISETTSQDNTAEWDSIRHLDLITALEEEFEIEFSIEDIANLVNFGIVVAAIEELI